MKIIKRNSFAELYRNLLFDCYYNPDNIVSPRGYEIKELTNVYFEIENPYDNLYYNEVNPIDYRYLAGELLWYFSGRDDLEFISKYSKFWNKIANKDGTCNSAYGNLLFVPRMWNKQIITEWEFAYKSLFLDKDTRQALIHFNNPMHSELDTKDFPCTIYGIFQIRQNRLNFTIHIRSNDLRKGLRFDAPFFMSLQIIMFNQLKENKYPELEMGKYCQFTNSSHIYSQDYKTIEDSLNEIYVSDSLPIIKENPIDEYGNPNINILNIVNYIMGDKSINLFDINDDFFKWLMHNAILTN